MTLLRNIALALALVLGGVPASAMPSRSGAAGVRPAVLGLAQKRSKAQADNRFLRGVAEDQFGYVLTHANQKNNHLPPDNVTIGPNGSEKVDPRTSPTNIGLSLLSTLVAGEMGIIDSQEAISRLRNTVETVQTLPKFLTENRRGLPVEQLYNWYSITGKPEMLKERIPDDIATPAEIASGDKKMKRGFVSAVDNGNFAASLIAIETALGDRAPGLSREIKEMLSKMRFDILFDAEKKGLFHHGAYDVDGQLRHTKYHFDTALSEARNLYAAAILLRHVDPSVWRNLKPKLGKEIAGLNVYPELGMYSWTGTSMEERFPSVFMRTDGTPLGVAERLTLALQMREQAGGLWGKSEANSKAGGYHAYGAHSTAHSKEFADSKPTVIAPYASQLATRDAPHAVAENLRRMEDLGMRGPYGFVESVDVEERPDGTATYDALDQFYGHHLLMGFLGIARHLRQDATQGWFHGSEHNTAGLLESVLSTRTEDYRQPTR